MEQLNFNENVLNKSIDELDISIRAHNQLKGAGITTLGGIIEHTESFFGEFPFTSYTKKELIDVVKNEKLTFKQ